MRNKFPGYYRPSPDEFKKLWDECVFVPDANILLHLFRYGTSTTAQVLDTLERLKPRVWIPHRVGLEFHRGWREVDQANRDAYDKLSSEIEAEGRKLSAIFDGYTRHQIIDAKQEKERVEKFVMEFQKRIAESKLKHPKFEEAEAVFNKLSDLIGDSVGEAPTDDQLADLVKDGKRRYEALIPPGFGDEKKKGIDAYGDYFIWKAVLDKAKEARKPVVLISDDVKADWWMEFRGQKIGPRPELVSEMRSYAGQGFYLYTLSQFLNYANDFLNQTIDPAAIQEIKLDEAKREEAQSVESVHARHSRRQRVIFLMRQRDKRRHQLKQIEAELDKVNMADGDSTDRVRDLLDMRLRLKAEILKLAEDIRVTRDQWTSSNPVNFLRFSSPELESLFADETEEAGS